MYHEKYHPLLKLSRLCTKASGGGEEGVGANSDEVKGGGGELKGGNGEEDDAGQE